MAGKPKFGQAPTPPGLTAGQEAFIAKGRGKDAPAATEPMHRFTVDIPRSLHNRFKAACANAGTKMKPETIKMIEARVLEMERGKP